jgi:hypothetical protein
MLLWLLPLLTYRRVRAIAPTKVWRWTGFSFGLVVSPASLGVYGLYWAAGLLSIFGFPLAIVGMFGLILAVIHDGPGYSLAIVLGICEPGKVVNGAEHLYIAVLDALVWAPVYGALGWAADRWGRGVFDGLTRRLSRRRASGGV